jgi:hypothetical protein
MTVVPLAVGTALLKGLDPPAFPRCPEALVGTLTLTYTAATERRIALAFGEEPAGAADAKT